MESIRLHRGVTLVELLVVLSIIGILTAVVVTSQSTFNKTILLSNTAYDVALAMRSAETYGLGSRVAQGGVTNSGYGIHFDRASPKTFLLFADTYETPDAANQPYVCHAQGTEIDSPDHVPGDCSYTSGKDVAVTPYALGNGMTVSSILVYAAGVWSTTSLDSLDIVFARPNTEVYFAPGGEYMQSVSAACITITSPQGGLRYVRADRTGNITVNSSSC